MGFVTVQFCSRKKLVTLIANYITYIICIINVDTQFCLLLWMPIKHSNILATEQ